MDKRLFLATTAAIAIATSAFAQSPSTSNSNSPAPPRQQDSTLPSSTSTPSSSSSSGSAQTNSSTSSAQSPSSSSSGQTASQSSSSGTSTNTTQAPAANNSSQAQTNQPSNQTPSNRAQTNSPSITNTQSANQPASGTSQAQSPTNSGSSATAQQPNNEQNTADRSSNKNVNTSVDINDQQRTRISSSISHLNVRPLTNVNFSLSVGTVVPRDIRLQPLPAEVVEIVPQYRGYNFVLVKDEVVVVEPSSYKIVAVLPYSGRATASAPARAEQRKTTFNDRDREVIRKHVRAHPVERRTIGSTVRTKIRTGERVPEGVEIEAFPETVYREAPTLREYRYINRDSHTYIVEPRERLIIEEID